MATIEQFEDIDSWKKARNLNKEIYKVTSKNRFENDFSLRDQLRRAANSIMLNIAEGFARNSDQEFIKFLGYAHGSAAEVQSALYIAKDQNYLSGDEFSELHDQYDELSRMINGFMNYLTD